MKKKNAIFKALNLIKCIALVLAVAILPPSISHAGSGDHTVGPHSEKVSVSCSASGIEKASSKLDTQGNVDEQSSSQCCNDICLSVVLGDSGMLFVDQIIADRFWLFREKNDSIEVSGHLQPPQV